jgi:CBS-domain-containing membrane protein
MNASDIMTSTVVTVSPDTSITTLARLLLDNKISAAPVVDEAGHVVGIVSEGDLLGRPSARSPQGWLLRLFNEQAVCLEELATARHLKARDVMTRRVVSVSDQTPIDLVASLMLRRTLKRVPIIRDGRLVGIVGRADLLNVFSDAGLTRLRSRQGGASA